MELTLCVVDENDAPMLDLGSISWLRRSRTCDLLRRYVRAVAPYCTPGQLSLAVSLCMAAVFDVDIKSETEQNVIGKKPLL